MVEHRPPRYKNLLEEKRRRDRVATRRKAGRRSRERKSQVDCSGAGVTAYSSPPPPRERGGGGDEYAGTYPAKMSTMVHIFADGARIRARICAPAGARLRGGGGGGVGKVIWPSASTFLAVADEDDLSSLLQVLGVNHRKI